MKNKIFLGVGISLLTAALLVSCDPTNPNNPNEQELITNVTLTAINGTDTISASYSDPDGNGGNAPTIDTLQLTASTNYSVHLTLLDETKNPVADITGEIEEDGEAHQFFYSFSSAALSWLYQDQDGNGNPVGLEISVSTGTASTGSVVVTLRHEPNKTAAGVSTGDITNAGGETDVEISFPVVIQ